MAGAWKMLYNLVFWSLYNPDQNIFELYKVLVLVQIQFTKMKRNGQSEVPF